MEIDDFRNMHVWQLAYELVIKLYETTSNFPSEEKFGLISDMRRAANSITHNIAEGYGRYEKKDKTRFYKISRGSCYELISQALVAKGLKYIDPEISEALINENKDIIRELNSIIKTLESKM